MRSRAIVVLLGLEVHFTVCERGSSRTCWQVIHSGSPAEMKRADGFAVGVRGTGFEPRERLPRSLGCKSGPAPSLTPSAQCVGPDLDHAREPAPPAQVLGLLRTDGLLRDSVLSADSVTSLRSVTLGVAI